MKNSVLRFITILFTCVLIQSNGIAQSCSSLNIQLQADIPSTCGFLTMTMIHDVGGRPYLYVANKEAGLTIYDISVVSSPVLVRTVPVSFYDSLDVMNLTQVGNYVYLAIGNHFNNTQSPGMAIVDVSTPSSAFVTGFWTLTDSTGGAGIVKVEGNYAYLGAMHNGLIILDVTDKNNILFVSQFIPDINYPTPNPNPSLYNARGMEVKNDIVFLCYDAGGLRIINTIDKLNPVETGRYSNPVMNGLPRAYNNIVLDDTLAYIAVDYCGMEVLNVADTANILLHGWWNPYNCPGNNWFNSPVHANEIQYNKDCNLIFLSTGKSDMHVLDVSNPAFPDSCNYYGGVLNNIGTWGIGLYADEIYLAYICSVIPFSSNWTGVKILSYTLCTTGINEDEANKSVIHIIPNPATDKFTIYGSGLRVSSVEIYNELGEKKYSGMMNGSTFTLSLSDNDFSKGIYFVRLIDGSNRIASGKLIVQ